MVTPINENSGTVKSVTCSGANSTSTKYKMIMLMTIEKSPKVTIFNGSVMSERMGFTITNPMVNKSPATK